MVRPARSVLALLLVAQGGLAANPIRRVVTLLQKMQEKVTEEGKNEEELYNKIKCQCKTGSRDLTASITAAEAKVPQLESSLAEAEASKSQISESLAELKADRAEAKRSAAEARALREKSAAAFATESAEYKANIAALSKAIAALEEGTAGSFLQTAGASALRRLAVDTDMSSLDRDALASFLSQGSGDTSQIIGILKQLKEDMQKSLAQITGEEQQSVKDFEALAAAKQKQIGANSVAVETRLRREGEVGVEIVSTKADLEDTKESLAEDKTILAGVMTKCSGLKSEWEQRSQTRSEELAALADAIRMLNDDEALDLWKEALPSSSLLQIKVSSGELRGHALAALRPAGTSQTDPRLALVAMALRGRRGSFDKVSHMIDEMVTLLGKEQAADDDKKAFCEAELDKTEDEKKALGMEVADLTKAIEEAKGTVAVLTEDIEALVSGVKEWDAQVAKATAMRKEEHTEATETMATNSAAAKLIDIVINRLAKFYTPKMYKSPPKAELTEGERIASNFGIEAPTLAPGGIAGTGVTYLQEGSPAFVQVSAHRAAPGPEAETLGAYKKKTEEHGGVVALLNMLKADLSKETTQVQTQEKNAQAEYEAFVAESAAKRAADTKSIMQKEATKAGLEAELQKMGEKKQATVEKAMAKAKYLGSLHLECDWLTANYAARKEARASEVGSLKDAKAVLAGADYSFVQTAAAVSRAHLRGSM